MAWAQDGKQRFLESSSRLVRGNMADSHATAVDQQELQAWQIDLQPAQLRAFY